MHPTRKYSSFSWVFIYGKYYIVVEINEFFIEISGRTSDIGCTINGQETQMYYVTSFYRGSLK